MPQATDYNSYSSSYGTLYDPGSGCSQTVDWVILGACNEVSTSLGIESREYYGGSCGTEYTIGSSSMGGYSYVYWYWHNTGGADYSIGTPNSDSVSGDGFDLVVGQEEYEL